MQSRVGLHHLCFRSKDRESVDEVHAWLKEKNAKIIHEPEEGPWAPGYYSVLFEDPDGVRLEVNHVPGKGLLQETEKRNMNANWMMTVGALIFFVLGRASLADDCFGYEKPENICAGAKPGLLEELQNTRMAFRKDLKSFWTSYIGFHFSHSLGLIFYALVCHILRACQAGHTC